MIRNLQIIGDSIPMALTSKNIETAKSRMETARTLAVESETQYADLLSADSWATIRTKMEKTERRYHTVVYLNAARAHLDKAETLKTEKAKQRASDMARQILREGLADKDSDKPELERVLVEVESNLAM